MSKEYTVVATFPSSKGDKDWTVKRDEEGNLSCDCPIWVFNRRKNRTCKHTDLVNQEGTIVSQIAVEVKEREVEAKGGTLAAIFARLEKEEAEKEAHANHK